MFKINNQKPLLIIDGYCLIFRAYHSQPPLVSPDGHAVGAIYGFTSMLMKLISEFKPEKAVIVLDHSGKNFRHEIDEDYKANRPPLTDDLIAQLKLVTKAAESLNFTCLSYKGFEADDIIATLARMVTKNKEEALIVSSDKDLMQLVNDYVKMYDPAKSKHISDDDIKKKFGVTPKKIRDVQALMGDSADNIRGVPGIGPKTASQLINQFGDLAGVFNSVEHIKSPRQRDLLTKHKEDALLSWKLVGLDDKVDINSDLSDFNWTPPDSKKISEFLYKYGFKSLIKRVENLFNTTVINESNNASKIISPSKQKISHSIINVTSTELLTPLKKAIKSKSRLAVSIERNDLNTVKIALFDGQDIYILPYTKEENHSEMNLFSYNENKISNNFNKDIHTLFEDKSIKKVTYNLKELLRLCDCTLYSFDDLQIMEYILSAGTKQKEHKDIVNFLNVYDQLNYALFNNKLLHLYYDIDLPLCYILHKMERVGIKIDINHLHKLSSEFALKIDSLEQKIFKIAGEKFNIASPKQLGAILFEKLKLPFGKIKGKAQGKTNSYSTNATILEKLQDENFEIADLLLQHRHLSKLKNTYTDSLPKQANPRTNRVHTTFLQNVTSTGRLSSILPNVQNIPVRTEEGRSIRSAFTSEDNTKLISADYSQIELKILSHVANISSLKDAFDKGLDIHVQTASKIFAVSPNKITKELRRKAKAINFGIIYGISAFGLSRELKISRSDASNYIDKYFTEYPEIKHYISDTIEFAKENNFVQNLIGRKSFIPTINDKNHSLRSLGERAAINAPIQGLASDIVKISMININKELSERAMKTKMILQIHDELIFEAPDNEIIEVTQLIRSKMQNILIFDMNLNVEIKVNNNWC